MMISIRESSPDLSDSVPSVAVARGEISSFANSTLAGKEGCKETGSVRAGAFVGVFIGVAVASTKGEMIFTISPINPPRHGSHQPGLSVTLYRLYTET